MKTAFSTLGCPDWKWREIISTAKDMGFDGVEVRGVGNTLYAPEISVFSDEKMPETLNKLHSINLDIPCVTSACLMYDYQGGKLIEEGKAYIDLAHKLGARFIRLLGDEQPAPQGEIDDREVIKNTLLLSDYAAENAKEVTLLIETNGVYSDTKRLKNLIENIGRDNVKVLWDIHHPYRYFGETPEETFENVGEYVRYCHLKDSVLESDGRIRYKMLGYGDIPLKEILTILKRSGYDSYLSLEWVKRWYADLEDAGVVFLQYLSYVKRTLAGIKL